MNALITVKPVTTTAELLAGYAAVRRRLFRPTQVAKIAASPATETEPMGTVRRRLPPQKLHFHDAHVKAYRRWQMVAANGPCTTHILKRCAEVGVPFDLVTGPTRNRKITHVRQMLMWELKNIIKPSIGYPELGRLFGGRDHTTALHAVRAHASRVSILNGSTTNTNGKEG